ncbi:hypothetical protein [Bradyrhizobium elkanii]|uniref:hypothetical protein n=1 Tax=Bradyrhizobium elkanii TaxID=29448 RepID=UPI003D1FF700
MTAICSGQIFTMNATEAATVMARLQAGEALRTIIGGFGGTPICSKKAFEMHCDLHPEWGTKAQALAKANSKSRILQGVQKRVNERTHCRNGHELTAANTKQIVVKRTGWRHLECQICRGEWDKRGRFTAEQIDAVEAIVKAGGTLADATAGKSRGGVIKFNGLAAAFREQPKLAARLKQLSRKNAAKKRSKAARARKAASRTAARRAQVAARAQALVERAAARAAERAARREGKRLPKASWEARYQLVAARTGKWTSYCRCCEKELPLANFYPGMRGGVTRTCISCTNAITGGRIVFTMNATEANRFIERLEAGETLRLILGAKGAICSKQSFLKHCEMHPEWAKRAQELATHNAAEALKRKGSDKAFANKTHCSKGHPLTPENVGIKPVNGTRYCKVCNLANVKRGAPMTPQKAEHVRRAILTGMRISDITGSARTKHRQIVSNGTLRTFRLQNPEFNRFIIENIGESSRRTLLSSMGVAPIERSLLRVALTPAADIREDVSLYVPEPGDYEWLYGLTPRYLTKNDRDMIVSDLWFELSERRLRREDAPTRVKDLIKKHNRENPSHAYGDIRSPLSLDAPAYLDGTMLRGETVSESLWERM